MKKPSDPTIAEKFNTYRPAYRRQACLRQVNSRTKEKVIDLLEALGVR